ncbi:hypothetical protein CR513_38421, partial [Mucuna pruriens]
MEKEKDPRKRTSRTLTKIKCILQRKKKDQAHKQENNPNKGKEWKFDKRKMKCHNYHKLGLCKRMLGKRRILIEEEEEELAVAPVFNKASVVRRSLQLRDQELFQDSAIKSKGKLIYSALIAEAELVEFDKTVTEKKWLKAMKEEINSIERIRLGN